MFFITRVDALRRIPGLKMDDVLQPGQTFNDGQAIFFRATRKNSTFKYDIIAFFDHLPDRFTGFLNRYKVGYVVFIHGCGHSNNEKISLFQYLEVTREYNITSFKCFPIEFLAGVDAVPHQFYPFLIDIEPYYLYLFRK